MYTQKSMKHSNAAVWQALPFAGDKRRKAAGRRRRTFSSVRPPNADCKKVVMARSVSSICSGCMFSRVKATKRRLQCSYTAIVTCSCRWNGHRWLLGIFSQSCSICCSKSCSGV